MGAKASKYDQTNWETSDGGMTTVESTLTKTTPTDKLTKLTCVPVNQINPIGVRLDMKVLADGEDSIDNPIYEVKRLAMFHSAFEIVDASGNQIAMVMGTGGMEELSIYTSEPNWQGQPPDGRGLNMYRRAVVKVDAGYYQMSCQMYRAPTEEESHVERNLTGVVDGGSKLVVDTVKWQGAPCNQTYLPSNPTQLVGWWKWNKPIAIPGVKDKIALEVAKNTDLILHIALVAIARATRAAALKGNETFDSTGEVP